MPHCHEIIAWCPDSSTARIPDAQQLGLRCEEEVARRLDCNGISASFQLHTVELILDLGEDRSILGDPNVD
eukprot:3305672-Pyramimonas_sp.AAC.1